MADTSSLTTCLGLIRPRNRVIQPKLTLLRIHYCQWSKFKGRHGILLSSEMIKADKIRHCMGKSYPLYVGRDHFRPSIDENFTPEPFWSNLVREAFWAVKSLIEFLVEQPSQLRYIEWPSLQSTLKTASLTLLLVGLLIISLSTVDSALCYILALLLRRRT